MHGSAEATIDVYLTSCHCVGIYWTLSLHPNQHAVFQGKLFSFGNLYITEQGCGQSLLQSLHYSTCGEIVQENELKCIKCSSQQLGSHTKLKGFKK